MQLNLKSSKYFCGSLKSLPIFPEYFMETNLISIIDLTRRSTDRNGQIQWFNKNKRHHVSMYFQSLIKEKLDEEEAFRQRSAVAAANRPHRDRKHKNKHEGSPPVGEEVVEPDVAAESHQSPVVNGVSLIKMDLSLLCNSHSCSKLFCALVTMFPTKSNV